MAWYNSSWKYRQKITIDHTKVDADLTDKNVLITEDNMDIKIFDHAKDAGADIRFTKSDRVTEIPREIELFDKVSNKMAIWVKNDLSSTDDIFIYIYYGNPSAVEPAKDSTYGSENVWDVNHKLVTHMRDDPDNEHVRDSTQYANDGTKKAAGEPVVTTDGKIDDAQDFDGENDYVTVSHHESLSPIFPLSISGWVKQDRTQSDSLGDLINKYRNYFLRIYNNGLLRIQYLDGAAWQNLYSIAKIPDLTWTYVSIVMEADGSDTRVKIYFNNGLDNEGTLTGQPTAETGSLMIGAYSSVSERFKGIIDEVRISNTNRSAAWIKASYESERDHLLDFGSEEEIALGQPMHLRRRGRIISLGGVR